MPITIGEELLTAIPLAATAAIYPPAFALVVHYSALANPRRTLLAFTGGALAMTALSAAAALAVFMNIQTKPGEHGPVPAAADLALAVALFATSAYFHWRRRHPHSRGQKHHEARPPSALRAAGIGFLMYVPSAVYLVSLKQVSNARAGWFPSFVASLVLVAIVPLAVELPVLVILLWPSWATTHLDRLAGFFRRYGRRLLVLITFVAGVYLSVQAIQQWTRRG